MFVIGITGSFGTGKSTVSKMFASYGIKIIDADKIVHGIFCSHSKITKKIIRFFGNGILNKNSTEINRGKLGKIVFQNRKLLKELCRIIHPVVIKEIKKQLLNFKKRNKSCVVAIDAPLLIEARLLNLINKLIVVKANRKNQIQRIKKSMNLNNAEIIKRIKAQLPMREKIKLADYVIDNNKDLSFTKRQVKEIYKNILKEVK